MKTLYNLSQGIFTLLLLSITFTLNAQKVIVSGFNYDSPDGFTLLALEDLPDSEKIFITETNYDATTNTFNRADGTNNGTWQITWTGTWTKGTIIRFEEISSNVYTTTSSTNGPTSPAATSPYGDAISLSNEGFSIFEASNASDPDATVTEIFSFVIHDKAFSGFDPDPGDDVDCPCSADFVSVDLQEGLMDFAEFKPTLRNGAITKSDLENKSNWNTSGTYTALDLTEFTGSIVLPVELVAFNTFHEKNNIVLTWQTANENNNEGFEIQRSIDAISWETLGFVQGYGTTLEVQNYQYTDDAPLNGINYYRLKQIDYDGQVEYSEAIYIEWKSDKVKLEIYPNPVVNKLTVSNIDGDENIMIYNSVGQIVKLFSTSNTTFPINVDDLPKGMYTLRLQKQNGNIITKQFMK